MRDPDKVCGANRSHGRGPCQNWKMAGKNRCKNHGGMSTGPKDKSKLIGNSRARKHDIYRQHMTPDEQSDYDQAKIGDVENELKLARVRVARILKAEKAGIESKTDYSVLIDVALARVGHLEKTRATLMDTGDDLPPLLDPDADI